MRVLVTGSSGFVGGHLAERLVREGYEVTGIDVKPPREAPEGWRDVRTDLRDADALARIVAEVRPEVVHHLAAQASVSVSMREPRLDIESNVIATVELARSAAEAGTRRFVFTSSGGAIFGEAPHIPAADKTPLAPRSIYGASKAAAEQYLEIVAAETGLEVAVVRPANIYGPAQDPHGEAGVVAIFAQRMLRGEPVTIFGTGEDTRDYVYVDDIVEAHLLAAAAANAETCVVGTGLETSTRRIFELLAACTGYERPPEMGPPRPGDLRRSALDPGKAQQAWGWEPRVPLEQGLQRTVDWFRERVREG